MCMKLNNAGKNMWLWIQTANKKLKQNAQTQDADDMQGVFCVICDSHFSTKILLINGAPIPHPATFPLRLQPRDMQYLKAKTPRHFPSLAPCAFLSMTSSSSQISIIW